MEMTEKRFAEILSEQNSSNIVLVLRGFTAEQLTVISNNAETYGCESLIPAVKPLDIPAVSADARGLLGALMIPGGKPMICIYEQYLSVCDTLNAGIKLTDRRFIVVDNNLFGNILPSLLPAGTAAELADFFDSESGDAPEKMVEYTKFYADVADMGCRHFGIKLINKHTEAGLQRIPFFETVRFEGLPEKDVGIEIDTRSEEMWDYILGIQSGKKPHPITIISEEAGREDKIVEVMASVLTALGVDFGVKRHNAFEEIVAGTRSFLPLLQKLHGENAKFRILKFYKRPMLSTELIDISQESVISDIVNQSEKALNGDKDFKNFFITAPTGAGKSLLFQLPAIHLSQEHNAVTIVVSPLVALMKDQVEGLERHGIHQATFLNSTISYEEREHRSAQIKNGEKSIVYLAPELLLSLPLNTLLGERKAGLFVVDEAHTVTSWGRDFRVDYWFLGDYLRRARRSGYVFPVLCLTATAVYGGTEDVVNDTVSTLGLERPRILLGNVKRENISFDVRRFEKGGEHGSHEQIKMKTAAKVIDGYVERNEKSLIYCPYTTQVGELHKQVSAGNREKVAMYHGQLSNSHKTTYQDKFAAGEMTSMICTKAYGMGIDVPDIVNCYHLAPTGNLADYVQEIGRMARGIGTKGVAAVDFDRGDMRYARVLKGMSGLKQYQLKEIMRKLYDIYTAKKRQNMLIAPDVFGYLFDRELENKVKNALLLIEKDLEERFGFPVIKVRPKSMFTKSYVCVAKSFEKTFCDKYNGLVRPLKDFGSRIISSKSRFSGDTVASNCGGLYEVDMSAIWEREFSDLTFADFKRRFFNSELFSQNGEKVFWPRTKITIHYKDSFDSAVADLSIFLDKLTDTLSILSDEGVFGFDKFWSAIRDALDGTKISVTQEFMRLILDMFVIEPSANGNDTIDALAFIQRRSSPDGEVYRVLRGKHINIKSLLLEKLSQSRPNVDGSTHVSYIPPRGNNGRSDTIRLLNILEILELASFEMRGGASVEIFVRINDPMKLRYLTQGRYSNIILREIERKNKAATKTLEAFFSSNLTTEQRWDVIENYFLGNEKYVRFMLGMNEEEETVTN